MAEPFEKNENRDEVLDKMRLHLRVHGDKDWGLVREMFPDILSGDAKSAQHRRFHRWRNVVLQEGKPKPKKEGRKGHRFSDDAAILKAKTAVGKNLPVAPPPAYISKNHDNASKQIDFLSEIHEIYGDVRLLREWSSKVVDGERLIKNPVYFDVSIKRRIEVLSTAITTMREIWDLKLMENFFDEVIKIIVEEIMPAEPEVARRVMIRLQELNAQRGMTVAAADPIDI